jgi:hypothetical protein
MLSLIVAAPDMARASNELPLMIAPRITSAMPIKLSLAKAQALSLKVDPPVLAGQRAALILGNRELLASSWSGDASASLAFALNGLTPGTYLARLRVDGADSLPFIDPDATVPAFDPAQTVEVKP